jgi:hypothetical protein
MWDSSIAVKSDSNISRVKRPFMNLPEKVLNQFNTSNDNSVINNTNNDIDDDEEEDEINEENIFEKSIGEQLLHTPINDTHRLFSSNNRFGKANINSLPLKRILVPKSKSPNIKNHGNIRNKNNDFKKAYELLKKNTTQKNEIFTLNSDFLHCRNCMLIVALSRYGKYYFNK